MDSLKRDIKRYHHNGRFEWYEPSLLVIIWYRFGQAVLPCRVFLIGWLLRAVHLIGYMCLTLMTGIQLPRGCKIGAGLRIFHFGCIVLNPDVIIGENCTLRHGVTIGTRTGDHDVPVIGNNVNIGAGAKILGKIKIGDNVTIGANAVVISDVPDNHIAVGVPARCHPKA